MSSSAWPDTHNRTHSSICCVAAATTHHLEAPASKQKGTNKEAPKVLSHVEMRVGDCVKGQSDPGARSRRGSRLFIAHASTARVVVHTAPGGRPSPRHTPPMAISPYVPRPSAGRVTSHNVLVHAAGPHDAPSWAHLHTCTAPWTLVSCGVAC